MHLSEWITMMAVGKNQPIPKACFKTLLLLRNSALKTTLVCWFCLTKERGTLPKESEKVTIFQAKPFTIKKAQAKYYGIVQWLLSRILLKCCVYRRICVYGSKML